MPSSPRRLIAFPGRSRRARRAKQAASALGTSGVISRNTIIAALVVIELAIVGEAVVAVRGGQPTPLALRSDAGGIYAGRLTEDGPHRLFRTGARPALNVDIGYADLTIITGASAQVDVSVSASRDFGMFRSQGAITATEESGVIRVASNESRRWSTGDDRMVTVVVPRDTRVTVINAGDVKATGLRAEASFKSVGQGSITIEDFVAPALELTSSGPITMRRVAAARLDVTSKNDRIDGTSLQVRDGSIQADDALRLGFTSDSDSLISATTDGGKIRASGFTGVAGASSAHPSAPANDDSSAQTVRIGAGTGRLDVHSNDGNIALFAE